ncbi:Structural maintenance of chromosomes protein 2 [Coelomomyces lativittatus]|nr:Structural maintenance of chromosomes protein 2 [Coelomomyces lativittatus]
MQGKITKVLNMKPMEILSMMEEAAGTRMFEERKEKALKTIFKKEKRLEEIQTLLQEELLPKLDKLRSEKTTYLEYQSTLQSKEKLERQVVLIEYKKLKALAQESAQSLKVYEEDLSRMEINIQLHQEKLSNIETKVSEMLSSKNDADLSQLEAQAATLNRELSKLETRFSLKLRAVEEEKLHLNTLLSSIQQLKQSIKHQEQQTQTLSLSIETLESLKLDKQREVDRTKEMLVSLSLNQSSDSFDEQIKEQSALLVQLQAEHNNLATKLKAIKLEQGNLVPEIEKMKLSNQKIENEMQTAKEDLMKKEKNLSTIKMQLESLSIEEIHSKLKSTTVNYNQCQEELDILSAQVAHAVRFDYHDPTPNFDRTLVKGPVASLITIEKSNKN